MSAELLELATRVAQEAAVLVRSRRAEGVSVAATKSSATDVVTEIDRASEDLIRDSLLAARPQDGFYGEEAGVHTGTSGVRWIVDPIDGTVNFLYGIPQYAVSIAAEADGEMVAGVVLHVPHDIVYRARVGGGATREGRPITVREPTPLAHRLVHTGFNYSVDVRRLQAAGVADLLGRVRDIRRLGSSALDVCGVAEGTVDAYVEEGLHLYDYAASALIANEAGAATEVTTGVGGATLLMCAPAHGFAEFKDAVAASGLLGSDRNG